MGRTKEEEATLPLEIYYKGNYFSRDQLASFVTQIDTVAQCYPKTMLEVGKGNGFVSDYFRKAEVEVTTVDVNPVLQPDVCGSILDLTSLLNEKCYDVVLCAEVLEHLPLAEFDECLQQLAASTAKNAILTLPSCMRSPIDLGFTLKIPHLKRCYARMYLPLFRRAIASEHYWEIGSERETSMAAIKKRIARYFKIERVFREFTKSYHIFIVLRKRDDLD